MPAPRRTEPTSFAEGLGEEGLDLHPGVAGAGFAELRVVLGAVHGAHEAVARALIDVDFFDRLAGGFQRLLELAHALGGDALVVFTKDAQHARIEVLEL